MIWSFEDYVLTLNTYSYLKLLFFTLQVTVVLLVGTKMTARLKNAVLWIEIPLQACRFHWLDSAWGTPFSAQATLSSRVTGRHCL